MFGLGASPAAARGACANAGTPTNELRQGQVRKAMICLINAERTGKRKLDLHKRLNAAARKHSRTMRAQTCLAHVCPGEAELGRRLRRYRGGASSWRYSEAVATNLARATPRTIVAQLMGSPVHRGLLLGRWEHAGVGVAVGNGLAWYTIDLGWKSG